MTEARRSRPLSDAALHPRGGTGMTYRRTETMRMRFHIPRVGVWVLVMTFILGLTALATAPAWAQTGDPGGTATGVKGDAQNAGGAIFLSEPTDKTASDYADKKKAYDDQQAQIKAEPLATAIADGVGQNRVGINLVWTLVTGYLVMFMQAGFALVETGFCRKKNAAHVMMTNFMIYGIGILGFFIAGYAFMFGGVGHVAALGGTNPLTNELHLGAWGILGTKGFAFAGIYDVGVMAHFLFNLVFMDTAA